MNKLYAMDTFFYHSLGNYPFRIRCEMIRELGYDAAYLTLWDEQAWQDSELLPAVKEEYGLEVAAVYAVLDLTQSPEHPEAARMITMLEQLQGCSRVELALTVGDGRFKLSDPEGDALAMEWLARLLPIAERKQLRLSLYPHVFFWLERWEDALRLIGKIGHPLLGMAFSSFHWYAIDGTRLQEALSSCMPHLHAVSLCGSRKQSESAGLPATIECIDQGELDLFAFLALLRRYGYQGPVGFQGYGMGGDAFANLRRNKAVYEEMLARLTHHPSWMPSMAASTEQK
ncbi:sugar phosphate isomerase/epimerase [Paenibacillaceae bacterium]|nr:sugar phosphate isomerase/epimerase [Paenibacillaceae bacterium]